jgi:hypothetical protein
MRMRTCLGAAAVLAGVLLATPAWAQNQNGPLGLGLLPTNTPPPAAPGGQILTPSMAAPAPPPNKYAFGYGQTKVLPMMPQFQTPSKDFIVAHSTIPTPDKMNDPTILQALQMRLGQRYTLPK